MGAYRHAPAAQSRRSGQIGGGQSDVPGKCVVDCEGWGDLPEKFCKWNSVALKADVRRDGQFLILLTAEVVPADVFRVRPGDVVPADQPVVWAAHSSSP
jgi:hypothetical protein